MIRIAICIAVLVLPPSLGSNISKSKLLLSRQVDGFEFPAPATISYVISATDGLIDVYIMEKAAYLNWTTDGEDFAPTYISEASQKQASLATLNSYSLTKEGVYIIAVWNPSFSKDITLRYSFTILKPTHEGIMAIVALIALLTGAGIGIGIFYYFKNKANKIRGIAYIPLTGVNTSVQ